MTPDEESVTTSRLAEQSSAPKGFVVGAVGGLIFSFILFIAAVAVTILSLYAGFAADSKAPFSVGKGVASSLVVLLELISLGIFWLDGRRRGSAARFTGFLATSFIGLVWVLAKIRGDSI